MLWGVDLGGTKIEGVVLRSLQPLEVVARMRISTEADRGYEHILGRVNHLVELLTAEVGEKPCCIGIGTPGALDLPGDLMKNCNTVCLNGRPLQRDLCSLLNLPVRVANDANCLALAEATMGAGAGYETVFGVIMGTGVGAGLVVRGHVLDGAQGIAGEWGHNVVDPDGELCYCGKRGCVETIISGPALERHFSSLSGRDVRLPDILALARGGDADARLTLDRLIEWFGRSLAQVINIFDPHAVVLGGGVGQVDELYSRGMVSLAPWVFNTGLETKLLKPELGDSAGVFGAAALCLTSSLS
jgi:fructokinase